MLDVGMEVEPVIPLPKAREQPVTKEYLAQARRNSKLNIIEFAALLSNVKSITSGHISNIERGRKKVPLWMTKKTLEKALARTTAFVSESEQKRRMNCEFGFGKHRECVWCGSHYNHPVSLTCKKCRDEWHEMASPYGLCDAIVGRT